MHEWALAEAVLKAAEKVAADEKMLKVEEIVVVLGTLQSVDAEAFPEIFREVRKNAPAVLSAAEIVTENEKASYCCRACGREFSADDLRPMNHEESEAVHFVPELVSSYMRCPACKSPDFSIVRGRGIYIKEIRGDK